MIYNRETKLLTSEPVAGGKAMKFLYGTTVGGICTGVLRTPVISKIAGLYNNSKFTEKKIKEFVKKYNVDLTGCPQSYRSFNEFISRKAESRDFESDRRLLISPADSVVTALTIKNGNMYEIKGIKYSLSEFLKSKTLAEKYEGGVCLIFRLRVYDYHRFCFPDDGVVKVKKVIPGFLDTVNTPVSGQFSLSTNYREVSLLKTENFGNIVFSEVGAMLVGKIVNTYAGNKFRKGDEKGYFEFGGSTVAMILQKKRVSVDRDILEQSELGNEVFVRLGEQVGIRQ